MSVNNFNSMLEMTKTNNPVNLSIAVPHTEHILGALQLAAKNKLVVPHLSGCKKTIEKIATDHNIDLSLFKINNFSNPADSINNAIELVKDGTCQVLMKGDQSTASIMSPVLKRVNNLRKKPVLSHVYALQIPTYHKLLLVTDGALNINPSAKEQVGILENAIELANALQINTPKIALLSAVEVPTPKMASTLTAGLVKENHNLASKAIIEGPIAFDAAINKESAITKHMQSEIAGDIDIALVPFIEAGNIMAKSLIYLARARAAGIILGAKVPVILTSRSDSLDSKFLSIALASIFVNGEKNA